MALHDTLWMKFLDSLKREDCQFFNVSYILDAPLRGGLIYLHNRSLKNPILNRSPENLAKGSSVWVMVQKGGVEIE